MGTPEEAEGWFWGQATSPFPGHRVGGEGYFCKCQDQAGLFPPQSRDGGLGGFPGTGVFAQAASEWNSPLEYTGIVSVTWLQLTMPRVIPKA